MNRRLAVLALLSLLAIGAFSGCRRPDSRYMNQGKSSAFSDGTSYEGMWLDGELEYIVFIPPMVDVTFQSSQGPGTMQPAAEGLTIIPEGLHNNGDLVDTSGMRKVFLLKPDGTLKPIAVDQTLLPHMRLSNIQELESSPIWPELAQEIRDTTTSAEQPLSPPVDSTKSPL